MSTAVGRGKTKFREFAMASGEMTDAEYRDFLKTILTNVNGYMTDGAVTYVCCDWRVVADVVTEGRKVFSALVNICIWCKAAGMGSMYRSAHEMIAVFRSGHLPQQNHVQLGRFGRNRSNLWTYPDRDRVAGHPTPKPVSLIADCLRDCSRRGDIVIDCCLGSGATLLAAERVGRSARAIEIDAAFVDLAVRRWQAFTGADAIHVATGLTFDELASQRGASSK